MASNPQSGAPERRPGRPPADGVDQRERLLDAAVQSFAEQGIAATSQRALAREAGVTPAMLNYYFGSKDKLIEAAVAERLRPILGELKQRMAGHAGAGCNDLIAAFVRSMHAIIERHSWLPGIWVREVLADGGQLRSIFTESFGPEIPRPLAERFAKGQADGELNPDLDPRLLFVSLIGLTMLPFAAAPVWRKVFAADDIDAARMLSHTLALLDQGVGA